MTFLIVDLEEGEVKTEEDAKQAESYAITHDFLVINLADNTRHHPDLGWILITDSWN